jgi:hypothetical protein
MIAARVSKIDKGVIQIPYNPWTSGRFNPLFRKLVAPQIIKAWDIYTEYDISPSQTRAFWVIMPFNIPVGVSTREMINAAVRKKTRKSNSFVLFICKNMSSKKNIRREVYFGSSNFIFLVEYAVKQPRKKPARQRIR